jgi:hypothetical protein
MNIETETFENGIIKLNLAGRMDPQGTEEIDQRWLTPSPPLEERAGEGMNRVDS